MSRSHASVRPTTDLLQRAAATSLNSARIIAHSIELIAHSVSLLQKAAHACARKNSVTVDSVRARIGRTSPVALAGTAARNDRAILLPLTPPRLLELVEEFRELAAHATTPESKAAFEDLVFRYTALAAGYDDQQVGSRMMH
jgi:hypothetical protein